ncbi:histidine kinase [Desulfobacterales bacterium HSG16]|nr:histidine kinase [Desulfobacterales bacterium HSG16]
MDKMSDHEKLKQHIKELEKEACERNESEKRIKHLNSVLNSIRNIHHLVSGVDNPKEFIEKACKSLVDDGGYFGAWIILTDEDNIVLGSAATGLGESFLSILEKMERDELIYCCKNVLAQSEILAIEDTLSACAGCPVSHMYRGRGAMTGRLEHSQKIYGVLTASVPAAFSADLKEQALFKDVTNDIAFALHNIEKKKQRQEAENELVKARDELELRVKKRTNELELLSSRLLNAQEEERKRIAADLHDEIGQSLSAAKFIIETAFEQFDTQKTVPDIDSLRKLVPMLQKTSEEVRTIVMNLRPSILDDLGILATIGWFCRQFQGVYSDIRVKEKINIKEADVSDALKTIIFRVMQEAMNNIAKHSKADIVCLYLEKRESIIDLAIEDNGLGFDMAKSSSGNIAEKGFGISGMKERTELSGGFFLIESSPGEGTIVRASWQAQK